MSQREIKHTHRELTVGERERVAEARRLITDEEFEIRRKAREYKRIYQAARASNTGSPSDSAGEAETGGGKPCERG